MTISFHPIRDWRNNRELARRRSAQTENVANAHKEYKRQMLTISDEAMSFALTAGEGRLELPRPKFALTPYVPPVKNLVCPDEHVLAMDAAVGPLLAGQGRNGLMSYGGFPGFPYLTELTQITEYRDLYEKTSDEMTRKWIEFRSEAGEDRDDIIKQITVRFTQLHVKEWFNWAARTGRSMGRAQLFMDFEDDDVELGMPLLIQKEKIKKGSLKRLKGIEPITTYPGDYNADDPLAQDYYEPSTWWVYSKKVHTSRLLTFIPHPLPDLLKPVYNFSGISLSQLAQPYVDYWLQTRDSVGRLLKNFSTTVFKTDMTGILQGQNYEGFLRRMKFYTAMQNNQGVFMCDKATEEMNKESTSLAGLDKLQAQAQEHMASVAKTPLTILFGLSPVGLTATAETDITIYNNHVNTKQESDFRRPLEALTKIVMLDLFGEIYDDITFDFVTLVSETEKEKALMRKSDGDRDGALITAGVVTPEEVRAKVAADPDSGFDNLDVDKPEGKLLSPQPGGAKKGGKAGGNPDASFTAAENSNDAMPNLLGVAADMMLEDAQRVAMDAGLWAGNQHTGKIGGDDEDPSVSAMKASAVAQKATNVAHKTGTRGAHERAVNAHTRALQAHKDALVPANRENKVVHENYIDAHEAAIAHHKMESAPLPEEVEL